MMDMIDKYMTECMEGGNGSLKEFIEREAEKELPAARARFLAMAEAAVEREEKNE